VRIELTFKTKGLTGTNHVKVVIEGKPERVMELANLIREKARSWEVWEEV